MGSSGAGKTSLLNVLSDRISLNNGATLEGEVVMNDSIKVTQQTFGSVAGYVMQDDILFENFTPREALTFAARLKLGKNLEDQDKRVTQLLDELGLQ